jgi:hypothetical protein
MTARVLNTAFWASVSSFFAARFSRGRILPRIAGFAQLLPDRSRCHERHSGPAADLYLLHPLVDRATRRRF